MDQQVHVCLSLVTCDGRQRGVIALLAARNDVSDLRIGCGNLAYAVDIVGMSHYDNLVDAFMFMEGSDGVFEDTASGYLNELFGFRTTHAAATAASQ